MGVPVSDVIGPLSPADTYPVIDVSVNAKGFPRAVANAAARAAIPAPLLSTSMFVLQLDTGDVYAWNGSSFAVVNPRTAFTSLRDAPSSYSGQAGKGVRVNAGATGLEFYNSLTHEHVWNEIPTGSVDGTNRVFTLAAAPNPGGSLLLFKNGLLQRAGASDDYTLSGLTVTFASANTPQTGDTLIASYVK